MAKPKVISMNYKIRDASGGNGKVFSLELVLTDDCVVAEIFMHSASGSLVFSSFIEQVPLPWIERLIAEAKSRTAPR